MNPTTLAVQQAAVAADARPWTGLGHGYVCNAAVAMADGTFGLMQTISTKRPARHLGGQPT